MKYLLDTCVISELATRQPNPRVIDWIDTLDPQSTYLSVITIGEIRKGIEKLPPSPRKERLREWLADDLLLRFDGQIIALDADIALAWGELLGQLELAGKPMSAMDSLIAASAKQRGMRLVTRNMADFQHAGVALINPWQE